MVILKCHFNKRELIRTKKGIKREKKKVNFKKINDNSKYIIGIIFEIILLAITNIGLAIELGITTDELNFKVFNYFTIIYSVLTSIYIFAKLIYKLCNFNHKNRLFLSRSKGLIIIGEIIVMILYHFVLSKDFKMVGEGTSSIFMISSLCLNYLVPIMVVLDYILFDRKGGFKQIDPVLWLIVPYIYFTYTMIIGAGKFLEYEQGRYFPYDFLDVRALGAGNVIFNIIVLTLLFLSIGFILYMTDMKARRRIK